jgi:UDP-N-acetylglucosamine 2-epimerase (non-hydrolysing)
MRPHITFIFGTRPEIIKLSPLVRECEHRDIPYSLIHTGQHYSDSLDGVFFEQLELPEPTHNLETGSGTHGRQTAAMIRGIESVLLEETPDTVLVHGDTNTALAGALAASKLQVTLGHVEAGLRSFDRRMPEEINREVADRVSDVLFAPTPTARRHLESEGVPADRIEVTGNTIVDAVTQHRRLATTKSDVLDRYDLTPGEFGLLTVHRAENVDARDRFVDILDGVARAATALGREFVYPVHPRARSRIDDFELTVPDSVRIVDSQDYLDFLRLQSAASIVLTDSGGVQEEACVLQVPCVTLRKNTERPETVDVGANRLAGSDPASIRASAQEMVDADTDWPNPFGDGTAAEQILEAPGIAVAPPEVTQ